MQWLMRALGTGLAGADMAVDADLTEQSGSFQIIGTGITDPLGVDVLASDGDDKPAILCLAAENRPVRGAADGEELRTVRQFDELRQDHPRHSKGAVQVPDRAGAALFGEGEGGRVEPFGHITCAVDTQEKEGNSPSSVTLQGGQAVANLFEAHPESCGDPVDIVIGFLREREHLVIGHQQGGCEIVGELYAQPRKAGLGLNSAGGRQRLDDRRRFDEAEDMRELKDPVGVIQRLRQRHAVMWLIEGAQRLGHVADASHLCLDVVLDAQMALEKGIHVVMRPADPGADCLGCALEPVEMIPVIAKEIVDLGFGCRESQAGGGVRSGEPLDLIDHGAVRLVELHQTRHQPGRMIYGSAQLREIRLFRRKQRITHQGAQIGQLRRLVVLHKTAPIDSVSLGQRHQHLHGKTSLIVLEQIHIGRADRQSPGHFGLGMPVLPSQLPQLGADECFGHDYNITIVVAVAVMINTFTPFVVIFSCVKLCKCEDLRGDADDAARIKKVRTLGGVNMTNTFTRRVALAMTATSALIAATATSALAQDWKPIKPVEMVIMAGQGGGADRLARLFQSMIQRENLSSMPILPVNKGGGSGAEALRYLKDKEGDAYTLMATLNSYYTTPLQTDIGVDIEEFTPIARMAIDTFVLWVNADSGITNLDEYLAAVKEAGEDWKMGGTGTNAEDSLVTAMLEQEFDVKMTYVPYEGGGDGAKALAGGHINSTVNNPSEAMGFYNAGMAVPIAAFTAERIPAFPDTPTMTELGHDLVYSMQRSFVAPKDMPAEAVAYYTEMFSKLNDLPEWQKYTQDEALDADFLTGEDLQAYFLLEREKHAALLKAMAEGSS